MKVKKNIDGDVIGVWFRGRIFKAISEKPKNAIKIKIECVVKKLERFYENVYHV